jgi:hypothetical protein
MAINQEDLAKVREMVLNSINQEMFHEVAKGYTRIILLDPNYDRLEYLDALKVPDEYKKEFKYPIYISYHSILYGVMFNDHGVVVKQIKRSYGEKMWKEIVHHKDNYLSITLYESLFIPDTSTYHLDWYKVSEGYNLDDLPSSCMKGKGDLFLPLDNLVEMAVLIKDSTNQMVARCIVWNAGIVEKADGTKIEKDLYDRLYYVDGEAEEAMISYLADKGIEPLNAYWCDTFNIRIKNPFNNGLYPWMDTFCILRENDYLYSYDWQEYGYSQQDITDLARDYPTLEIIGALLSQDGAIVYPCDDSDEDDENFSAYENECIPANRQVYSNYLGDILTDSRSFQSSYDDDWYPINGKDDVWLPIYPNPEDKIDYVVGTNNINFYYWTDRYTNERYLIPREDTVIDYVTKIYIPRDRAIYLPSRDLHIYKDVKLADVVKAFTNANGDFLLTPEELAEISEELNDGQ